MANKKVKNATKQSFEDFDFKSKSEVTIYKELVRQGFSPEYEPCKFILVDKFRPKKKWYLNGEPCICKNGECRLIDAITYTPDFKISYNGYDIFIEVKGFANDVYPYKRKLFLRYIDNLDIYFCEVNTKKALVSTLKQLTEEIDEKIKGNQLECR